MFNESSKDRTNLCLFTFADGRRCNTPQSPGDMGLCYHHAQKLADRHRSQLAGNKIAHLLNANVVTACDLSAAFNAIFIAAAQGHIKPKLASTLAYLGHLMLHAQQLARAEYIDGFNRSWNKTVRNAPAFHLDQLDHHPEPVPGTPPALQPDCDTPADRGTGTPASAHLPLAPIEACSSGLQVKTRSAEHAVPDSESIDDSAADVCSGRSLDRPGEPASRAVPHRTEAPIASQAHVESIDVDSVLARLKALFPDSPVSENATGATPENADSPESLTTHPDTASDLSRTPASDNALPPHSAQPLCPERTRGTNPPAPPSRPSLPDQLVQPRRVYGFAKR